MSRYIDAEWLKAEFPHNEDWNYPVNTNSYVVEMIDEAPHIDIVRCKECRHCKKFRGTFRGKSINYYHCNTHSRDVESDDFCSWGEREGE